MERARHGKSGGISRHGVHQLWPKNGLKPHRAKTFKLPNDPRFAAKFRDVIGLYLDPPERARVLACDDPSTRSDGAIGGQGLGERLPSGHWLRALPEAAPDQGQSHRRAAIECHAGFDASLEETAIAIVDETGRTVREAKAASEIAAIDARPRTTDQTIARLGLDAGPLSCWLPASLKERGFPATCIETRRPRAATRATSVKSDREDAEAIAQVGCKSLGLIRRSMADFAIHRMGQA